jgi:hypothetical protein
MVLINQQLLAIDMNQDDLSFVPQSTISSSNAVIQTSLSMKSESNEPRIREIIDIIVATAKDKIAFVILFGPFARGDLIFEEIPGSYYFLIITKAKRHATENIANRLEKRITDEINKNIKDKNHPIHLMIEPIDYFNCSNNQKKYFFADVKKKGYCFMIQKNLSYWNWCN